MRRSHTLIGLAVALVALVAASVAIAAKPAATTTKASAALNIGQVKPHPKGTKAGASGRFTATIAGTSMTWKLTTKSLTGPATAAHIHVGAKGVNGGVVVPLCGPCTSAVNGTAMLTADQLAAMKKGQYYVNVHTAKNPNGEIRGQITVASS